MKLSCFYRVHIHMHKYIYTHTKPDVFYLYPIALRVAGARAAWKFTFGLEKTAAPCI